MASTRRRLLQVAGGAGAGLLFTPVPWRLVSDSALWTQNWSWLPKVPRGEPAVRMTHCSLCSASCALRVRSTGGIPTGLGPAGEPLCPAGFVGHHLMFHPHRLRSVLHGEDAPTAGSATEALRKRVTEIKTRGTPELVAVLDLAPGRTASLLHKRYLAKVVNGCYLEPPQIEGATATAVSALLAKRVPLAIDLERTKTVLSIGTPIAAGWGSPRRVMGKHRNFRLIHADSERTHTADIADEWLAIKPGSELAFLLAVAHVVLDDAGESVLRNRWTDLAELRTVAAQTDEGSGIDLRRVQQVARTLASTKPAVVIADGDPANGPYGRDVQAAAAALNALLGSVGTPGGYAPRVEVPAPPDWAGVPSTAIESVEDGSIGVLIIDEPLPGSSLPWVLMERKLAKDALVIACTWTREGVGSRAEWRIPAPVFLESAQDAPSAPDSVLANFSVSDSIIIRPQQSLEAAALIAQLAGEECNVRQALEARAQAIHSAGRGILTKALSAEAVPVKSVTSEEFWKALLEGGRWQGERSPSDVVTVARLLPAIPGGSEVLSGSPRETGRVPGWRPAAASPLLAKLWQESELMRRPGSALG